MSPGLPHLLHKRLQGALLGLITQGWLVDTLLLSHSQLYGWLFFQTYGGSCSRFQGEHGQNEGRELLHQF